MRGKRKEGVMPAQHEPKIFEIGLAMAGAISAGAYSAGVLDFLLQALAEWERARQAGEAVPDHRVVIKVVSGASAGAITGALGAVALAGGLKLDDNGPTPQGVLPGLYETWVVRPEMVASGGDIDLLSGQDLAGDSDVVSVLNAILLDRIKDQALTIAGQGPALPFVAKDLHIYMSLANLRGVPYVVKFSGGSYGMQSHGDRAHYIVRGLGLADAPSIWAGADDFIPLDVKDLAGGPSEAWRAYGEAALASGAFPVGLAPREIHASTKNYDDRRWPIDVPQITEVKPGWPLPWAARLPRAFDYLSVDGGLINNEPFEYTRFALMKDPPNGNERAGDKVDRAVLMIDPFPEPPAFLPDNKPDRNLVSLVMALFPGLKNQARFKPSELVLVADETIFSRFLIAPHRQLPDRPFEERYAIACGLLGGFGGFLDRAFRDHDFQLGRRNCQRFLRESFSIPGDNPIIQAWPDAAKQNPAFRPATPPQPGEPLYYDIIPLVRSATREVALPAWPRMNQIAFEMLQARIKQRLELVAPALIRKQAKSRKVRAAMKFAVWIGKDKILDYVRYAILSDLIRRDQIAGWDLPPLPAGIDADQARRVVAELANPAFDLRTERGIAVSTSLDPAVVSAVIAVLLQQKGKPYEAWQSDRTDDSGAASYTLAARKPSWFWRLPGVSVLSDWLAAPAIG
jgi:hypothetical protein